MFIFLSPPKQDCKLLEGKSPVFFYTTTSTALGTEPPMSHELDERGMDERVVLLH